MKRRTIIAAAPAALLLTGLPTQRVEAAAEHPWETARRLASELSDVLAVIRDDKQVGGHLCVAVVHPGGQPYATGFADIDSYDEGWAIASEFIRKPGYVDPLMTVIDDYRKGTAAYNALPDAVTDVKDDSAVVAATFGPSIDQLSKWDTQARSAHSALEAMVIASEEVEFLSDLGQSMFAAAFGYLLQINCRRQVRAATRDRPVTS